MGIKHLLQTGFRVLVISKKTIPTNPNFGQIWSKKIEFVLILIF